MDLIINDTIKNIILELINKFPGSFRKYDKSSIEKLKTNIASRDICVTALESIMYDSQQMRCTIKTHSIYDKSSFDQAESIYLSIPKAPDYIEDSGIFYEDIPQFKDISNEELLSFLSNASKAQKIYERVLSKQSFTSRAERILQSIKSLQTQTIKITELEKKQLDSIYTKIGQILGNGQNINLQDIDYNISLFNSVAISIWNRYLDEGRCFLVHNYSRGYVENYIPSKYLSTSLLSDKFMALFQENRNNNYGIIVKPKKIVSADSKDTFTHNRSDNTGADLYLSGIVPPLLFPWEIEREAIEKAKDINGEILNYDNGYVLPEIVLEDYVPIGVFYRTNGEGELSLSYESARELAQSMGLEITEIDMSLARMKAGLPLMTVQMQKAFFLNILRKHYMGEKLAKSYFENSGCPEEYEDEKIILKYLNDLYEKYVSIRRAEMLSAETLIEVIMSTISQDDLTIIKSYYETCMQTYQNLFLDASKTSENPFVA